MLSEREAEFARNHRRDSDEQLIEYLKECAEKLGKCPNKADVVGFIYLKQRLGPWPRILERVGLKEKSPKRLEKERRMNWTKNSKSVINHASIHGYLRRAEKKQRNELKRQMINNGTDVKLK